MSEDKTPDKPTEGDEPKLFDPMGEENGSSENSGEDPQDDGLENRLEDCDVFHLANGNVEGKKGIYVLAGRDADSPIATFEKTEEGLLVDILEEGVLIDLTTAKPVPVGKELKGKGGALYLTNNGGDFVVSVSQDGVEKGEKHLQRISTEARDHVQRGVHTPLIFDPKFTGKYMIVGKLGEGGMATVWDGEEIVGDAKRPVAIKEVTPLSASTLDTDLRKGQDDLRRQKFLRECGIMSNINHPNVVQIIAQDKTTHPLTQTPTAYAVVEKIDGGDLKEKIKTWDGLANDLESVRYHLGNVVLNTAKGLAAAHNGGVVHCDVKPANIFLTYDSLGKMIPKIGDFGIAGRKGEKLTEGEVAMSPPYAAPEQWVAEISGDKQTERDEQTDIFSLGIVLHEVLEGTIRLSDEIDETVATRITFAKDIEEKLNPNNYIGGRMAKWLEANKEGDPNWSDQHIEDRLRKLLSHVTGSRIPDLLKEVVLKAVHPLKKYRYESMQEFAQDLEYALEETKHPRFKVADSRKMIEKGDYSRALNFAERSVQDWKKRMSDYVEKNRDTPIPSDLLCEFNSGLENYLAINKSVRASQYGQPAEKERWKGEYYDGVRLILGVMEEFKGHSDYRVDSIDKEIGGNVAVLKATGDITPSLPWRQERAA